MTDEEFMALSVPERITRVWKDTKSARGRKHMTVSEFADALGVSTQTVHAWRRTTNPQTPSEDNAEALAKLSGRPVTVFVPEREEAVTLESIDARLADLEASLVKLSSSIREAVRSLREAQRQAESTPRSRKRAKTP